MNWHTPALLHERGFLYDSSLLDGDAPYRLAVSAESDNTLVEIPVDWALDDWEQYAFYPGWTGSGVIESPAKAREMWLLEAVAQHRQGGCWVLTNHPFISGRPSRLDSLEELVEQVKALDGDLGDDPRRNCRAHRAAGPRSSTAHALRGDRLPGRAGPGRRGAGRCLGTGHVRDHATAERTMNEQQCQLSVGPRAPQGAAQR